jgi:PKD repeat protein
MKSKKALQFYVMLLLFCTFLLADAGPEQEQTTPGAVKVIVRFANIRSLADVNAKIIDQVGYGTMLMVLGKSDEFYQVNVLNASTTSVKRTWYIQKSDVAAAGAHPFRPAQANAGQPDRQVTFEPKQPVAGQRVTFIATNFRTPNLLKWDMGDGAVLASGNTSSRALEARLAYAYAAAGTYRVKVYDDNGDLNSPPLTFLVLVAAYPRSLQVKPEKPLANQLLTITAINFNTPENIFWDLGDGNEIKYGDKNGIVKPMFMITHIYTAAGTYTIKAWDAYGNKSLSPVSLSIQVAADQNQAGIEPAKATIVVDNTDPAQDIYKVATIKPGNNEIAEPNPDPTRVKKNLLIKIGPYTGYFLPQDALFKNIYGQGEAIYGGRLGLHLWQGFYLWFSASQFKTIGKTTFSEDKTTLILTPLSVFLRCGISLGFFKPYAGIGYTYMGFKEESVIGTEKGNGRNLSLEAGFELKMSRHFLLDFGARFDQIKIKPEKVDEEIDLGGLQAGVTLLVSF